MSIAQHELLLLCVISSNNNIITIFVCMIYMEGDTGISFKIVTMQPIYLFKMKDVVLIVYSLLHSLSIHWTMKYVFSDYWSVNLISLFF